MALTLFLQIVRQFLRLIFDLVAFWFDHFPRLYFFLCDVALVVDGVAEEDVSAGLIVQWVKDLVELRKLLLWAVEGAHMIDVFRYSNLAKD